MTSNASNLKEEIIKALENLFSEYERQGVSYEKAQWELDYIIYPHIGSFLATGELSKEEGKEIFEFCERRLRKLKKK